jgi:YbbR domain-containing protein
LRRPFAHLGLKLVSLGLAVLLWYVVAGEKTSEIGLTVPVELQNLSKELEVVGAPIDTVEVRLRATPAILTRLSHEHVSLRVDLAGVPEGEHYFHLTEQMLRRPFGVSVVRLNPASLTLDLERTLIRDLPIRARVVGTPAPGFEVADVTTQPAKVRVAGPRSRVQALTSVFTETVSVDQAHANVSSSVNIGIGDPLVRIQGDPRVRVTAHVRECQETRLFPDVKVLSRGGRVRLHPARVNIVVAGQRSLLAQMTSDALRPYVDVGSQRANASRPVTVEIAAGFAAVEVRRVEPAEVVVTPLPAGPAAASAAGAKP